MMYWRQSWADVAPQSQIALRVQQYLPCSRLEQPPVVEQTVALLNLHRLQTVLAHMTTMPTITTMLTPPLRPLHQLYNATDKDLCSKTRLLYEYTNTLRFN